MWHALCDKVRACGVQVMMYTPVLAHEKSGTTYTVMLDDNVRLRCRRLIFCANAFMQQLLPSLSVVPARGQVLISKPISGLPFKGIYHFDRGYYYFREIDGRVLFGGGRQLDKAGETTMQQGLNEQILEDLKLKLQEMILPGVPVAVDTCWSGIMGFSNTKLPICQDLGDNCFVLAGFGGMGVALAPYMAKELVGMIS